MTKMIKLSLAAAIAATGMSAAVVDNVKMSGNAKLFYETNNKTGGDLFDQDAGTNGQVIVNVAASASVGPVTANVRHATITTAGLENVLVAGPQTTKIGTDTTNWTDIANLSVTMGGTTLISGLQELNTPLCFTEKWNVTNNTFDANVLVNKTLISGTTLVYADVKTTNADGAHVTADGGQNTSINTNMIGAHTTIAGVPVNAYYYDFNNADAVGTPTAGTTRTATWIDAKVAGANLIVAQMDPSVGETATAMAISGATKVAGLNVFAAYSTVSDDSQSFANASTAKKTKLPTQAVYVDGEDVAAAGADTFKIKLSGMKVGGVNLAIQHVVCDTNGVDDVETDIIATTKIGGVAIKALLMQNEEENANKHERIRVYANYSF